VLEGFTRGAASHQLVVSGLLNGADLGQAELQPADSGDVGEEFGGVVVR
jgi:hypothetical protein